MPIQKLYSNQGVLAYEDLIDRTILLLCEQLETRFVNGNNASKTCDIADWISYCGLYPSAVSNSIDFKQVTDSGLLFLISFLGSYGRNYVE